MLRSAVNTLVRKGLGETTSAFWTDVEINTYINNGISDIAFRTKCLRTDGQFTLTADTSEYTLSSSFTGIFSVLEAYIYENGSSWERLERTNRDVLNRDYPGWKSADSGTPTMYMYDREEDNFVLHVPPDSDNAGSNYCEVYYAYASTDIDTTSAGDSSTPEIPQPLHLAIVDFAIAKGLEDRGWQDKANDRWQKYFAKLNDYEVERRREKEDEEIIMIPERNL